MMTRNDFLKTVGAITLATITPGGFFVRCNRAKTAGTGNIDGKPKVYMTSSITPESRKLLH
jgi:anaerobic selenocysteine-containing dehydrogenase